MKYRWVHFNVNVKDLHLDGLMPRVSFANDKWHDPAKIDMLHDEDREFVRSLKDIHGVICMFMDKYDCRFVKGAMFDWADLEVEIIEAFRLRFVPNGRMVRR